MLKKLSEEARFTLIIVIAVLMVPLVFYLLNLFTGSSTEESTKSSEMRVIVTEAQKKEVLSKLPPEAVIKSVREVIKQGNHSTAYMQLGQLPEGSPAYEELRKLLEKEAQAQKRPGVRKVADKPQNPVKYFDESTPRDRSEDAFYVYLVDIYGTLWPRICIQSAGKKPIGIVSFSITVDGKSFTITPSALKTEKLSDKVAEYHDALLDKQSYTVLQALIKSRKALLTCVGITEKRTREISEEEKKGLVRIMDTYAALGGNFAFAQTVAPLPNSPTPRPKKNATP